MYLPPFKKAGYSSGVRKLAQGVPIIAMAVYGTTTI
jgi:hypothetical protein